MAVPGCRNAKVTNDMAHMDIAQDIFDYGQTPTRVATAIGFAHFFKFGRRASAADHLLTIFVGGLTSWLTLLKAFPFRKNLSPLC